MRRGRFGLSAGSLLVIKTGVVWLMAALAMEVRHSLFVCNCRLRDFCSIFRSFIYGTMVRQMFTRAERALPNECFVFFRMLERCEEDLLEC